MFRRNTGLSKPYRIDITVGCDVTSGSTSSRRWQQATLFLKSFSSTARTLRRTAPPKAQKGAWAQAIGTSRGGRTSKIHCLANICGRSVAVALTPGNITDIRMAVLFLEAVRPTRRLLADKAMIPITCADGPQVIRSGQLSRHRRHANTTSNRKQSLQAQKCHRAPVLQWRSIATRLAANYYRLSLSFQSSAHGFE